MGRGSLSAAAQPASPRRGSLFQATLNEVRMKRKVLLAWLGASILLCTGSVRSEEKASPEPAAAPQKQVEQPKFVRVRRDDQGQPLAMETAVVRYIPADAGAQAVAVDLIGAVHVGDKAYYDELNKLFESYDVLLYELVAPEGTKVPKEGR